MGFTGVATAGRIGLVGVVVRPQGQQHLLRYVVPDLQGALQHPQLLGEGIAAAGLAAGVQRCGERPGGVTGVVPVAGEAGRPGIAADERLVRLQRGGVAAVDPAALAGQQVVHHGLAHQGVAEAVALALRVGEQDVGADGGAQRLDEVVLGHRQHGCEQTVLNAGTALRGHPDHGLRPLGQRLHPHQQDVPQ
ncbi:hypothetical protein AB0761_13835 [Peterkaempfera sp. SMS 1(5)a]